ncbi:MAG: zinc ribbon domain-containing protein [SAR324 cluster bacterium]|nr:zinc ribbon domain-containing protein [SAR324 cluster bacterium]
MPIYEYGCAECGHEFEEMQKFSDPPLQDCPQCEQPAAQRKISISAFHLKGGGWYKDGYGSAKPETSGSDTKSEKPEKSAGAEAKTDATKPEASGGGKSESKSEKSGSASKSESAASKPAASKTPAKTAA